jgi:serine/threonine-protein phosphatase 2A regulatory subunit B''
MAAAIKTDELLIQWLSSDSVYENAQKLIDSYRAAEAAKHAPPPSTPASPSRKLPSDEDTTSSPRGVIPPFYPKMNESTRRRRRRLLNTTAEQHDTWLPLPEDAEETTCVRDQVQAIFRKVGQGPPMASTGSAEWGQERKEEVDPKRRYLSQENFARITKEVSRFPSFFNVPLYNRILLLWNSRDGSVAKMDVVTMDMFQWYWLAEMESYDAHERFFRLLKQPENDFIGRDDFLPYIKELLNDHPVSTVVWPAQIVCAQCVIGIFFSFLSPFVVCFLGT